MKRKKYTQWPEDRLEIVNNCPVCGCSHSQAAEKELVDLISSAPTTGWQINICKICKSGFLFKRPMGAYIQDAYHGYHTHTVNKNDTLGGRSRRLQNYLRDQYYDYRNGDGGIPTLLVYYLSLVLYPVALYFEAKSRHIFQLGNKGSLLDVGCGNGEFLEFARKYGWNAKGVDFDSEAVSTACSRGLDVLHGGIDAVGNNEQFDLITLSHVIEHVYEPAELLNTCMSLLRDGGVLWLETPNIESIGYRLYGADWRGLEPPRHLAIFNRSSLLDSLNSVGFSHVVQRCHGLSGIYMALASDKIKRKRRGDGVNTFLNRTINMLSLLIKVILMESVQLLSKRKREYLTFMAIK